MNFRRRLLLAFWLLALGISLLFSLFAMVFAYTVEDRFLERQLEQEGARLSAARARTGAWPAPSAPQFRLLAQAAELPDGLSAQLAAEPQRREFSGAAGRHYHLLQLDGAWLLAEVSDWLVVRPQREGLLGWLALWTLGMLAAALALGAWLARRLSKPLQGLAARLQQGRPEALPQDLSAGLGADEVGQLARALDALHARTQAFIAREQAFTRDASHELRTPLAVLKLALEDAQPDARQLARMRRAAQQLEQTLDSLLWLAREPGADAPAECAPLPLIEQWALDQAETLEGRPLQLDLPRTHRLALPEPVARLVLGNLLGNALAHGRGAIHIGVAADGALCIRNPSPALPAGIGQPFVKGESSTGIGLGLAIVQGLLERHGARLALEHQQGWTELRLWAAGLSADRARPDAAGTPTAAATARPRRP
ncbi:sensor histidine kinase [Inhella proteolytica]|uniref:histidine kinase n=1 Tax=Inhella proteolytica TaxID=2795029 RepID=A0A931NG78_9BURK|nr:HAMP domain-containing sensor histidine kinase [Inhella proteolytica]MBH9576871.1 HAMP domain-containing histidine kinase [Inhella proteolytica]